MNNGNQQRDAGRDQHRCDIPANQAEARVVDEPAARSAGEAPLTPPTLALVSREPMFGGFLAKLAWNIQLAVRCIGRGA